MSLVTIWGGLGTSAPEIGKKVADILHANYVDQEIIADVAARLRLPEKEVMEKEIGPNKFMDRIYEALKRCYTFEAGFAAIFTPLWLFPLDNSIFFLALKSVILEMACNQPIVIQGRGSQFILKECPKSIHILVVAPMDTRIKFIMLNYHLDQKSAKKEIERSDNMSLKYFKKIFNADCQDPKNYDLVINTDYFNLQASASIITGILNLKSL
jgi:hypothetical protein